jgi:hypothetical protein
MFIWLNRSYEGVTTHTTNSYYKCFTNVYEYFCSTVTNSELSSTSKHKIK